MSGERYAQSGPERYEKLNRDSDFTTGTIYKARDRLTGGLVSLKKYRMGGRNHDDGEGIPSFALREIALLKELVHPNIVQLRDVQYSDGYLAITFEWLEQDLQTYLTKVPKGMSTPLVKVIYFALSLVVRNEMLACTLVPGPPAALFLMAPWVHGSLHGLLYGSLHGSAGASSRTCTSCSVALPLRIPGV